MSNIEIFYETQLRTMLNECVQKFYLLPEIKQLEMFRKTSKITCNHMINTYPQIKNKLELSNIDFMNLIKNTTSNVLKKFIEEFHLKRMKTQIEESIRETLLETIQKSQDLIEEGRIIWLMKKSNFMCQTLKNRYSTLEPGFMIWGINLSKNEFDNLIDDLSLKVLNEFIELPNQ